MELILLWLATILISYGMEISFIFIILKNCADVGYTLNMKNLNEISKSLPKNNISLIKWIPVINILFMLKTSKTYVENLDNVIEGLYVKGIIEKMTNEEINEYKEKPTALKAYLMTIKNDEKYKKYKEEMMNNKNKHLALIQDPKTKKYGIIFYTLENKEIKITKTMGEASNLSYEEQLEWVLIYLKHDIMRTVKKYGNTEELTKNLFDVDNLEDNPEAKKWQEKLESVLPNEEMYNDKGKKRTRKLNK